MRWLVLVLVIACGAPRSPREASPPPEEQDFFRGVELAKTQQLAALAALDDFVMRYPNSKWRNDALLKIAELHFDLGHIELARAMYGMAQFPADDDRGWFTRYKIAWCDLRLGQRDRAIAEMTAVANAEWTGAKSRAELREFAKKDLETWRDSDSDPTYLQADQLYADKKFCEAAPLYAQVARGDTRDRDEAAYAHVLSTISCEHLDDARPDGSPAWQHVVTAIDFYVAHTHVIDPAVRYKRGQILYATSRFTEAAADFRAIVHDAPADETAQYAAALLLDCDVQGHGDLAADLPAACAIARESLGTVCPH